MMPRSVVPAATMVSTLAGLVLLSQALLLSAGAPVDHRRRRQQQQQQQQQQQLEAAEALLTRVLGSRSAEVFRLEIVDSSTQSEDFFELRDLPVPATMVAAAREPRAEHSNQRQVGIRGSSGVALASGLHWYLKHGCNISVAYGPAALNKSALPTAWPSVSSCPQSAGYNASAGKLTVASPFRFHYYFNPVAHSYAAAFWDWNRWEGELDFMAMMGVNLPLATTGQEWVWDRLWKERFNLTTAELAEHWPGPAFLAWGRMGNLQGWGGTYPPAGGGGVAGLTHHWMLQQRNLQRKIVARARSLGMKTVLAGFAGHVPRALEARYPSANISRSSPWGSFSAQYSANSLLEASDPLFGRIGRAFVEIQTEEFGTDHIYSADTFNEMAPRSFEANYIQGWGSSVHNALNNADPEAVWLVQGWSLQFWPADALRSYWSDVPEGRLLVLDLDGAASATSWQQWTNLSRPVISCILDNFGGTRALEGPIGAVATQALRNQAAAPTAEMIAGIGWAPEDTHSNPIVWQVLSEAAWRGPKLAISDLESWVSGWALRRYYPQAASGTAASEMLVKAWQELYRGAYGGGGPCTRCANCESMAVCHDPACKPQQPQPPPPPTIGRVLGSDNYDKDGVARIPSLTLQTFQSCNASSIVEAWRWLLAAAEANPALISSVSSFRYDLVDVGRQVLMDLFPQMYSPLVSACSGNHSRGSGSWGGTPCALAMLNTSGPMILELATDFDRLLRTETHFGNRLAEWIASARAFGGTDSAEQDWLEWNARMQVTLWGSPAPALYDYASKQWSGLVAGYHVPQWRHFLQRMGRAAASSSENPYAAVQAEIVEMAEAWVASTQPVEGVSGESPLEVGKALFSKYCK